MDNRRCASCRTLALSEVRVNMSKRDIEPALMELVGVLESAGEQRWAASLRRLQARAQEGASDPTAYKQVIRDMLSIFGGMGSFSDLVLYRNGVLLREENDRLEQLRGQLFEAARDQLA